MLRQIILDTETTGLSTEQGHRIIEIGCVELKNRLFTDSFFHHYLHPEREIDAAAQKIHGLSLEFLADKPKFHDIAEAFVDYIQGAELIIHNADFDVGFLNYELMKVGKPPIKSYCKVTDTLKLARKKHPGQKNNLDALCKRYQVDASKRQFHGALLDAQILGDVYLAMTAGQIDFLAGLEAAQPTPVEATASTAVQRPGKLLVLSATTDELTAHQTFLEKIKNKSKEGALDW